MSIATKGLIFFINSRLQILFPNKFLQAAFIAAILHFVAFAVFFSDHTWDDAAITMAFGKNLIEYGDFVSGPLSPRVEGSSSMLWTLFCALLSILFKDPGDLLSAVVGASLWINMLNIFLVAGVAGRMLRRDSSVFVAVLLFALSSVSLWETTNGMETPLLLCLTLLLGIFISMEAQTKGIIFVAGGIGFLISICRFEAIWIPMAMGLAMWIKQKKIPEWTLIALGAWLGYQIWHYRFFGAFLPNSVLAKTQFPYSPISGDLLARVGHHLKPFWSFGWMYLPLIGGLVYRVFRRELRYPGIPFGYAGIGLMVGCLLINLAIGQNAGPLNRMFYVVLPIFLIAAVRTWEGDFEILNFIGAACVILINGVVATKVHWNINADVSWPKLDLQRAVEYANHDPDPKPSYMPLRMWGEPCFSRIMYRWWTWACSQTLILLQMGIGSYVIML